MLIDKSKRAKRNLENLPCLAQNPANITFIYRAEDFKHQIIQLIRQAKTRIYITALYWQNDEAGQQILAEIYQAKRTNPQLDIKILVDWHRAQRNLLGAEKTSTNADWYAQQRHQQDEALFWGVPINTREIFGVLHIKGFIFDDTLLYSGASINNIYLCQQQKYRYDRYHQIINPALADCMVNFINQYLWDLRAVFPLDQLPRPTTKEIRQSIRTYRKHLAQQGEYQFEDSGNTQQLRISPLFGLGGQHNVLNRTIEDLLLVVEHTLIICTPYFNLPRSLQQKIRQLLQQGKQVEIIVGDKTANDFYISPEKPFKLIGALPYLYEKNLRAFSKKFADYIKQGNLIIRTWKNGENSYHLKGVWVDDRYILLTGNNLNPRAWRLDAENGLLIQDPLQQLKPQVAQELQAIRQHTQQIKHYTELQDLADYPLPVQKLLKKFARIKADALIKMVL
ncbi:CDP-diacylglycerol--serine O-phosphatidyltransferase [Volucribacter amazonae]|uniref:Phosphatidylserine synthase n=1 Tax=Volucribacter amazonae TaxID=256731 RepID=A0A9X4PB14_9PAST|nr:CDP-diacylglycerol--serine O-phosphatidyltransferase [Volucribacter amazonae]MDG6894967.1 phosphatidylserine synthase [Volucribacter amazonae]